MAEQLSETLPCSVPGDGSVFPKRHLQAFVQALQKETLSPLPECSSVCLLCRALYCKLLNSLLIKPCLEIHEFLCYEGKTISDLP